MDEKEITTLLRSHDFKQSRRTWRCPDENQLAAYVNGQSTKLQKLEKHLSGCKPCIETIALLVKQFDEDESVPAAILARARSLGENARTVKWNWGWTAAAATACLLIGTSIVLWQVWSAKTTGHSSELVAEVKEPSLPSAGIPANVNSSVLVPSPHIDRPKLKETRPPGVRGEASPKPALVFPREGSMVRLPVQALRWLPVQDATFYEVKVVTEDGAAVATQRTNNTELLLAPDAFSPGSRYFVTVVAHLSGNRTIRSDPVKFVVAAVR